jgi:hypothetical protein
MSSQEQRDLYSKIVKELLSVLCDKREDSNDGEAYYVWRGMEEDHKEEVYNMV